MCELKGSLAAHKKYEHLLLSVGLAIFAFLTTACGGLTSRSDTEATPQPADGTLVTTHETAVSTRPQPELPQDPKFTHITIDQGLSDQVVLAVLQDSAGFMWFGTINGLNRYDGYHIVEYRNDPADPHSLSNNSVEELHEDRSGTLWVATRGGLNAFDWRTQRFTRYQHDPENPRSLSNDTVYTIHEDQSGDLWIATLDGLNRFDHATGTFTAYFHDPEDPNSLSSSSVRAIHEDQSGVLWVGTLDGLNRFDHATGTFTAYRHDPDDPQSLSHNSIYGIYSDRSGALWLSTDGGGINRFDQTTGNFTTYRHDADEPNSLGNDQVDGFFEDAAGALWVSTFGGGVSVLDPDRETITTFRYASDNPASLSHDTVADIAADRSGSIWLATQGGGVSVYNPWQQAFTNYQRDDKVANSLASNIVWSVYEDQEGLLWIGTRDQGLDRFDRRSGQIDHYPPDPQSPQSLGHPFVLSIVQDPAGALWVGTFGGGLYRLDPASGSFRAFRHDPADPQSLSSDIISDLFIDASGQLWIGTTGGLNLFDQKSGTFTSYRHDPDNPQSLSQDIIMKIAEDQHGRLWIATGTGGLNRMEPDTGKVTRYLHNPEDPTSLGSNGLTFLHVDQSGVLWIGTASAGLDRLDPEGDSFTHYREGDGLASDRIVSILEEGDADELSAGNLWIATGKGLSRLDRDRKTFRSYGVADGLPLTEFHRGIHKTRSGELLLGSTVGMIVFNPADLTDDPYIPPIVFTDFFLANEPVKIGADSPLQQSIDLTDVIELTYADQKISIEFAALSYSTPSQNRYRYRLEGFEEDWIEVDSTRRLVTYTNLDPGSYVFRVTGSNGDAMWNEVGREVTLVIAPPWWETWWFRGGILLGLVAGGFAWQRQRGRRRERQLQAQVDERTEHLQSEITDRKQLEAQLEEAAAAAELARDLHDSVTQVLFSASLVADVLPRILRRDPDLAQESVQELRRLTRSALAEMRTMLLELRPSAVIKTPLDELLVQLTEAVTSRSGLQFQLYIEQVPHLPHDVQTSFYRIAQEALNNVVKHAQAKLVTVSLSATVYESRKREEWRGEVILSIKDDGQGFSLQESYSERMGISFIRERVASINAKVSINSQPGHGTELTLVWHN
jgi:ligand-binding sensor domain-containing protein/signal transduction histidine kinase